MVRIEVLVDINAPTDAVWDLVSDLDDEPKFWKGTKNVRNISRQGNVIVREVTIAFRDQKCMQEVTLEPKNKIHIIFTEGIIEGTKTIVLLPVGDSTQLKVVWDIKLSGVMGMFTGMIKKHIKCGTERAVDSIKKEAECR